ncbi:helix-turn-helix domain-containing protein [Yinghuangia seranimata]|uniref:helix-turn-helix domain-containing protein n=1 Tax=Yinghuangia seranimata TaxID=408067 RepID=UPI00248B2562|nr:helix-turn-helix transcriptional regulator [Yinghuangia seranimata]MDI2131570.1 helix-turn-helix transcriptional regulator [Yinghuangia seranimata]
MANPRNLDPTESPRAFYGAELRRLREEARYSQERLGELVFCSGVYIGQIETAVRKPQLDMSKRLDEVLKTGGLLTRLCRLVNRTRHAEYFAPVAELEALATEIYEYAPMLVPGLLQTPEYAKAVILGAQPMIAESELAELVAARIERSQLLERQTPPLFWAVLDESVLRRPVGGASVMREQLAHIADLIRRRRVAVQVLPYAAGAHALMDGFLKFMDFEDAPSVAYIEGVRAGQLLDDPATIKLCRLSYDCVRAAALSPEASLDLIVSAAEDQAK